jgi:hypothetical protein
MSATRRAQLSAANTPEMLDEEGKPVLERGKMTEDQAERPRNRGRAGGSVAVSGRSVKIPEPAMLYQGESRQRAHSVIGRYDQWSLRGNACLVGAVLSRLSRGRRSGHTPLGGLPKQMHFISFRRQT